MKCYGIVGWKNSGKTHLIERLIAEFCAQGMRIATIKHAHHGFDIDQSGRDSFRHRSAGAREVLIASDKRWALMHENAGDMAPPSLSELMSRLSPADLVLIEGFKSAPHAKIEASRRELGKPLIAENNASITAIVADYRPKTDLPFIDLNDTKAIGAYILREVGL